MGPILREGHRTQVRAMNNNKPVFPIEGGKSSATVLLCAAFELATEWFVIINSWENENDLAEENIKIIFGVSRC